MGGEMVSAFQGLVKMVIAKEGTFLAAFSIYYMNRSHAIHIHFIYHLAYRPKNSE